MTEQFTRWDSAEYLKTEEDMANYLDACMEEAGDDPAFIAKALGTIARARGMTNVSRDAGLARESLYSAFCRRGTTRLLLPRHLALSLGRMA